MEVLSMPEEKSEWGEVGTFGAHLCIGEGPE